METFTAAREFIYDPRFASRRSESLKNLDLHTIDAPIIDIISTLSQLPYCYTIQCCWGHFVHKGQKNQRNLEPLSNYSEDATVKYRIAYLAICIQPVETGIRLYNDLRNVVQIDPQYIQFGSADWVWKNHINSYALQVEPERFKLQDTAIVNITEALRIQTTRDHMFGLIREICSRYKNIST